jgi:hypothetical protein
MRDGRGLIVVDSTRDEAYVRNISLSSTSPDVDRFGMMLQGIIPAASRFRQVDAIALMSWRAITAPNTPSALDRKHSAFGAALSAARSSPSRTPANHESTFNMSRRIMAERGRRQRRRTRRIVPDSRRDSTAAVDARTDDALRTLVRVLARQAAREAFELELRRETSAVH